MNSDYDSYSEKIERAKARLRELRALPRLSFVEKTLEALRPGERLVLYTLITLFLLSTLALLAGANSAVSAIVPSHAGALTEGLVGPARFINPLLALSAPDKDLSALVYSGLMRATPEGNLLPDLAQSYEISEDGTTYTFKLRDGLSFQDGSSLSSADVLFTIQRAQNPDIKSHHRADWEGVTVSTPDTRTIIFTLPQAYAPFLENLTLGILPRHLWESVSPEEFPFAPLNTRPVGSGPYRIVKVETSSTGAAERYELASFKNFALGEAYLKKITFIFYPNEEALVAAFNAQRLDAVAGLSPSLIEKITRKDAHIVQVALPRTFGVFLNQNKNAALADASVRAALDIAVDKKALVSEILKGYGVVLEGPVPPGVLGGALLSIPQPLEQNAQVSASRNNAEKAKATLSRGGWTFDEATRTWTKKKTVLEFTLSTADEPELAATAQALASAWQEAGIKVNVHVYPLSELNTVVLRPRNYEAVLFGEVVGRTLDLFAFWHSSQRNDPGLNLALYTNAEVDRLLARARTTTDKKTREKIYQQFSSLVAKDQPAVFLYAPEFIYLISPKFSGVELGVLTSPGERFMNVHEWYTDTERVWNIFGDASRAIQE